MKKEEEVKDERRPDSPMRDFDQVTGFAISDEGLVGLGEDSSSRLDIKSLAVSQAW